MKKIIAAAAIAVAALAAPVAPVQAATLEEFIDSCWWMPLLKDECAPTAPEAAAVVTAPAVMVAASAEEAADTFEMPALLWGPCSPAPEGSKFLFVCE
jgi:hypothetical protein